MATGKRGRDEWADNSQGIARQDAPARHRTASGAIRPLRHMTPPPWPLESSQDVANFPTAQLPPRPVRPDMQLPRFYVDESVMFQEMKKYIEECEQLNQRMCSPYPMGTQAGIYTDVIQSKALHFVHEAVDNLHKARNFKRAYMEQHAHDDPPEGA